MSGVCGIVMPDGASVDDLELEELLRPLEQRGPDGRHSWTSGAVALGHTLLATTREALGETLPLTDNASGCTITADVRLDNRDELLEALGLASTSRIVGDGELILRAYLAWGQDCPKRLLGDFAFAIWDARSATLFCARDHMGMRQLTYCRAPGGQFIFATEPGAIAGLLGPAMTINQQRVGDFLGNMEGADLTSTFFDGVFRLPPAHVLILSNGQVELSQYWQLQAGDTLMLPDDEAYARAFADVFTQAVACRLRTAVPIGAMLSGGIDSTQSLPLRPN